MFRAVLVDIVAVVILASQAPFGCAASLKTKDLSPTIVVRCLPLASPMHAACCACFICRGAAITCFHQVIPFIFSRALFGIHLLVWDVICSSKRVKELYAQDIVQYAHEYDTP